MSHVKLSAWTRPCRLWRIAEAAGDRYVLKGLVVVASRFQELV
jgi:hypothetical protein